MGVLIASLSGICARICAIIAEETARTARGEAISAPAPVSECCLLLRELDLGFGCGHQDDVECFEDGRVSEL